MKAGDLGDITVYIKSKEIIEDEKDEETIGKEDHEDLEEDEIEFES